MAAIKKITADASRAIGQYVRRNPILSAKEIADKLKNIGVEVSCSTVTRHLVEHGYQNALPLNTPMLTSDHKKKRIEWAKKHIDDNWNKTLFSDETSLQLFRIQ